MKTSVNLLLMLSLCATAQDFAFSVETNTIHLVFEDSSAPTEVKELFLSDFKAACQSTENGLSVETEVRYLTNPPYSVHTGWVTNTYLHGVDLPMFFREEAGYPSVLVRTNDVWLLSVNADYTDNYSKIREFALAHTTELDKLRKFIAEDLAPERLASLPDEDIYKMYLDKQWHPGDLRGLANISPEDRPPPIRGTFFPLQIAGVFAETIGPSDAFEHLWAFLKAKFDDSVIDVPAIYWRDKWWITFWQFENDIDQMWTPSEQ